MLLQRIVTLVGEQGENKDTGIGPIDTIIYCMYTSIQASRGM